MDLLANSTSFRTFPPLPPYFWSETRVMTVEACRVKVILLTSKRFLVGNRCKVTSRQLLRKE